MATRYGSADHRAAARAMVRYGMRGAARRTDYSLRTLARWALRDDVRRWMDDARTDRTLAITDLQEQDWLEVLEARLDARARMWRTVEETDGDDEETTVQNADGSTTRRRRPGATFLRALHGGTVRLPQHEDADNRMADARVDEFFNQGREVLEAHARIEELERELRRAGRADA